MKFDERVKTLISIVLVFVIIEFGPFVYTSFKGSSKYDMSGTTILVPKNGEEFHLKNITVENRTFVGIELEKGLEIKVPRKPSSMGSIDISLVPYSCKFLMTRTYNGKEKVSIYGTPIDTDPNILFKYDDGVLKLRNNIKLYIVCNDSSVNNVTIRVYYFSNNLYRPKRGYFDAVTIKIIK